MTHLLGIPVPDTDQIVVGAELVVLLFPVKLIMNVLYSDARQIRNRIIKHHVKSGHMSRFKHCVEGECSNLRNPMLPPLVEAEVDLDLDLQ